MKFLNGQYYVVVRDRRYKNHLTENIVLRKRDPPKCLRTHYRVQNETEIGKNQKVLRDDNDELVVRN